MGYNDRWISGPRDTVFQVMRRIQLMGTYLTTRATLCQDCVLPQPGKGLPWPFRNQTRAYHAEAYLLWTMRHLNLPVHQARIGYHRRLRTAGELDYRLFKPRPKCALDDLRPLTTKSPATWFQLEAGLMKECNLSLHAACYTDTKEEPEGAAGR